MIILKNNFCLTFLLLFSILKTEMCFRLTEQQKAGIMLLFQKRSYAGVMELADVTDSKSVELITRVGSSPTAGT